MKLVKSLLLGGAAGLVAVSGASAADLAITKPAPAEYVRICSAEGAGFFYIPGTETCLKISGRVRFDVKFNSKATLPGPKTGFGYTFDTSALIKLDTRTQTSLGTLRGYAEIALGNNDTGSGALTGLPARLVTAGDVFISLGGFTVGRLASLYGFDDPGYAKNPGAAQIQYLATFGSGFYVGAGVEDIDGGVFSQEVGGVLAAGYQNGGTNVRLAARANTNSAWGIQLQAQQAFGSGTTVFAAADFEDKGDGFASAVDNEWSVTLKLSQAFSDQFSGSIAGAYQDNEGIDTRFKVVAGVDYTLVPGFVIGPEVVYENINPDAVGVKNSDSITGRLRFQRNF
jgi:hypothetical protein